MKKILKQRNGFTLIEVMVVVTILAVLAAIVSGGVVGTKSRGEASQVQADAQSLQQAIALFNNSSRASDWPEDSITMSATMPGGSTPDTFKVDDKDIPNALVASIPFIVGIASTTVSNFTYISWTKLAVVRQTGGTAATATFVPDFILRKPDGTRLYNVVGNPDYLWLLKKGSAFEDQGRVVQVWKLNDAGTSYEKVFPKVN